MASRILVVDDEAGLRAVLQDILELEGYDVAACSDVSTAEQLASENDFDAALLDVFLTDEPVGIALAKQIGSVSPKTKVILMTGYAEESDIASGYESGVSACIRKPFILDDVIRSIELALDAS
ncbi:MAG: response regulator [Armatimonadota bacterium]